MLRLIRSDWYRETRIRGLRGGFWQYALVLAGIAVLEIGLMRFDLSGGFGGAANIINMAEDMGVLLSPSEYLGTCLFGSYSILAFATSFGIIEQVFVDLTDGFGKTLVSSTRGRLAYFAEKVLFAGTWSAAFTLLSGALSLGGFALFVMIPFGLTFSVLDSIGGFILWILLAWLAAWVASVVPLAVALFTRSKLVTYGLIIGVLLGWIPLLLQGLAYSSGGILKVLQPIAPALLALSSWMPSTVLHTITNGAGDLFAAAGMPGTGALPTWGWMLGTCLIWLLLAGGAWIAAGRKRGV